MKEHFLNMLEYDIWANQQVWLSIIENPILNSKIELLFSHLLSAQIIWLNRCKGNSTTTTLWDVKPDLNVLMIANHIAWKDYLENLLEEDFEIILSYKASNGMSFRTSLKDIFTHLFNHSTYHRGQIVQLLKQEREEVPITDYIYWVR